MDRQGRRLATGVRAEIAAHGLSDAVTLSGPPCNMVYGTRDADGSPSQPFRTLMLQELLLRGVLAPSLVISAAHTDDDVDAHRRGRSTARSTSTRKALADGRRHVLHSRRSNPRSGRTADGRHPGRHRRAAAVHARPVHADDRGFFTRTFDSATAAAHGIDPASFVQDSQSRSHRGVVRGMHVRAGRGEAKYVRCASGAMFDVVVDLRAGSPTFRATATFRLDDVDGTRRSTSRRAAPTGGSR